MCECMYLHGPTQHVSFEKSVGMITEYDEKHGDHSANYLARKVDGIPLEPSPGREHEVDLGRYEMAGGLQMGPAAD